MKYILIANNDKINFHELKIDDNDLLIIFGKQYPLKFDKIKDYNNKILFLRNGKNGTNHQEKLKDTHSLYKQIIIFPKNNIQNLINTINGFDHDKIINIYSQIIILEEYQNFPSTHIPTTGFIAYLYVKYYLNKNNAQIILLGFDGRKFWSGHNALYEQLFYQQEILNNNPVVLDFGY